MKVVELSLEVIRNALPIYFACVVAEWRELLEQVPIGSASIRHDAREPLFAHEDVAPLLPHLGTGHFGRIGFRALARRTKGFIEVGFQTFCPSLERHQVTFDEQAVGYEGDGDPGSWGVGEAY